MNLHKLPAETLLRMRLKFHRCYIAIDGVAIGYTMGNTPERALAVALTPRCQGVVTGLDCPGNLDMQNWTDCDTFDFDEGKQYHEHARFFAQERNNEIKEAIWAYASDSSPAIPGLDY